MSGDKAGWPLNPCRAPLLAAAAVNVSMPLQHFIDHEFPKLFGNSEKAPYVPLPAKCTTKTVTQAILRKIGGPAWDKGTGAALTGRIRNLL